ncbi:MAG: hypothetical protein ABSH09_29735 [Bryobacteraceae bacterium]
MVNRLAALLAISFDGLLIEDKTVYLFVSTYEKEQYVLAVDGVRALAANCLQAGNIVLDVQIQNSSEITLQDVMDVYRYQAVRDEQHAKNSLDKAQREELVLVSVNPSYGASCLVLAESVELLKRQKWAEQVFLSVAR